jgi:hypothetical protein
MVWWYFHGSGIVMEPLAVVMWIFNFCGIACLLYLWFSERKKMIKYRAENVPQPATVITQTVDVQPLHKHMDEIPGKILTSITNSTNTYKGALGELIGYIQLRASYDRIIPLGSIVDFIGIKFPSDNHPGCIDFIDVKTGHKARLSKDQRSLQQLIKDKKINFCKIKVEASDADFSK